MPKINHEDFEAFALEMWNWGKKKRLTIKDDYIMATGLGGETGEVLEVLKKAKRDKKFNKNDLANELGDVLYYVIIIAHRHGLTLNDLMTANRKKLERRFKRRQAIQELVAMLK